VSVNKGIVKEIESEFLESPERINGGDKSVCRVGVVRKGTTGATENNER